MEVKILRVFLTGDNETPVEEEWEDIPLHTEGGHLDSLVIEDRGVKVLVALSPLYEEIEGIYVFTPSSHEGVKIWAPSKWEELTRERRRVEDTLRKTLRFFKDRGDTERAAALLRRIDEAISASLST